MAEILLTHSYFMALDPKEQKAMMPYAPLGTLYACSQLRQRGFSVALFDSMLASGPEDLLPVIEAECPKLLVVYDDDFNYLTKMCLSRMRGAAFSMIRLAKKRGCLVAVHGSDPGDHALEYLRAGADYLIVGEGEKTLLELAVSIRAGGDTSQVGGLAYLARGIVVRNREREPLRDLDSLPHPAWDMLDVGQYRMLWLKHHGYFSMNLVTTRGCPFHCNWCAKPVYGQVYHSHSPERVVEELLRLKIDYRPDHLWFCDDIFGLKPGWIGSFADEIIRRDGRIPFKCLSRADLLLKDETVRHLARSGCQTVWIGAESGSQRILDAMDKGTTVPQIYEATRLLHEHGIRVGYFLQYGYPGEKWSDIELTLRMVKETRPDEIGVSVSYPLPGTKFFERVKADLGLKRNWVDSQDLDPMIHAEYSTEFYRTLHHLTHKKFRVWQGMDLLKRTISGRSLPDRRTMRRIALSAYHAITLPRVKSALDSLSRPTGSKE